MINIGLDTGRERHQFHILDQGRTTRDTGILPNASWAFEAWAEHIESTHGPNIQIAVEARNGLASPLDQYLEGRGWRVVQIPPTAVKSYRENVMGQQNKTDATDAHALALLACDAGPRFEVRKQPRRTLRRLTRQRACLVKEQTQAINRLRQALAAYWPELTDSVVPDLAASYVLTILERHPDPAEIASLGVQGLRHILRSQSHPGGVSDGRLAKLVQAAQANTVSPQEKPVILAEARFLVRRLRHVVEDVAAVEAVIAQAVQGDADARELDSLDGISTVSAATFVAEVQDIANFATEPQLASYAGLGLSRRQTGKTMDRKRPQRRANRHLKVCLLNVAAGRVFRHPPSRAYYDRKRGEGKNHKQALRALARHVVRLLYGVLRRLHRSD